MRTSIALALLALPAALAAQGGTVSPGMTRAQVVSALGPPVTARDAGEHSYLFYRNECGRACGMNDLVVLQKDTVVDAIFRSPSRRYTGTSSSPTALSPEAAASGAAPSRPVALPVAKEPAAPAPTARKQATDADRLRLRQQLLGAGLTSTQIRARLRAEGYPESLLDADMRGAAAASSTMKPGAPNDTRPSIPAGEPLRPATSPAPATTGPTTTTRPSAP
ncbi:MAG: hypothetical protein JWL60_2183 [Gemmatimonadetes bacterium]|jgi:hypothetical protein|nr:hypothetical protein [Gemmatimonadota bacterium]